MSSLRLTTQLQQKMVLTPQLRQRIEMLQMTSMELNELIELEMVSNPLLEEIQLGEEQQEISENILDQNSDGTNEGFSNGIEGDNEVNFEAGEQFDAFAASQPTENGFEASVNNEE